MKNVFDGYNGQKDNMSWNNVFRAVEDSLWKENVELVGWLWWTRIIFYFLKRMDLFRLKMFSFIIWRRLVAVLQLIFRCWVGCLIAGNLFRNMSLLRFIFRKSFGRCSISLVCRLAVYRLLLPSVKWRFNWKTFWILCSDDEVSERGYTKSIVSLWFFNGFIIS
jgi:hypothetical protein